MDQCGVALLAHGVPLTLERATSFKIAGSARRDWDLHVTPHSIEDVVDAFFSLSDDEINEREESTPFTPTIWIAHARIFGQLFMMNGHKNSRGEWTIALMVAPVWPPPAKEASDDEHA